MADFTPYVTAKPLFGPAPSWIADEQERQRIQAYMVYEQIYWGVPQAFKLVSRGEENSPIYVPSGRQITETMHRYLAKGLSFITDPTSGTNDQDRLIATQFMDALVKRERFYSRFSANKRYGIIRGDWMFHLYADPAREAGARLSLFAVDPASVFPIYNEANIDEIIGYHIAEVVVGNDGKQYINRLTYRKQTGTGGPSPIDVTNEQYEVDKWGGPGMDQDPTPVQVLAPPQTLPSPIDQLPIYHIQNFSEPGQIWGSSEFRGLERIMAAVNQSISDEELSLAMDGLGVWVTDAGTPINDEGEEVPWDLGPGRVTEIPEGKMFQRANSNNDVTPYQSHVQFLQDSMDQSVGIGEVAKGRVDVTVAESGVALALNLAPTFARVDEKEQVVTDVLNNMLFDLRKWAVAYEGGAFSFMLDETTPVLYIPKYGDRVPQNTAGLVQEAIAIAEAVPQIVPMSYIRDRLRKLGYDDMPSEADIATAIQAEADATGARVDQTVNDAIAGGATTGVDLSNLQ